MRIHLLILLIWHNDEVEQKILIIGVGNLNWGSERIKNYLKHVNYLQSFFLITCFLKKVVEMTTKDTFSP